MKVLVKNWKDYRGLVQKLGIDFTGETATIKGIYYNIYRVIDEKLLFLSVIKLGIEIEEIDTNTYFNYLLRYILEETSTFSESNARKEQSLASEFDKYMNDFYLENGYDKWNTKVKTSAKEKYFSGSFKLAEQFFSQRDDESSKLINGAKNKSEKEYRIQWLSEGSLKYHLLQRSVQHGGDPEELELYREYLRYKNLFLMKNGYSGSK